MSEAYNLDRHVAIENNVDALGKKWEIVRASRENALLKAVPNPFREDFVCPPEFDGAWTSVDRLQEQITIYLNRSWDMAEAKQVKNDRKAQAAKEAKAKDKITPVESLEALPEEVKEVLGDVIATTE